jgi:hypothetical protein
LKTFDFHKCGKVFAFRYYSSNGLFSSSEEVEQAKLSRHLDALHAIGYVMKLDAALS